ncbi:MAG: hypothetical protein WDA20_05690 [Desulfuromonadales bacterium]
MNLIFKALFSKSGKIPSLVFLALTLAFIAGCGDGDDESVSIQTFSLSAEYNGDDQPARLLYSFQIDYLGEPTPEPPPLPEGINAISNAQELETFSQQIFVDLAELVTFDFTLKDYFVVVGFDGYGEMVRREANVRNKLFIYEVDYARREGWDYVDGGRLNGFIFDVNKPQTAN